MTRRAQARSNTCDDSSTGRRAHTHTWRDGRSARRLANAAPLMMCATDEHDPTALCSLLLPLSLQASVGGLDQHVPLALPLAPDDVSTQKLVQRTECLQ